MRIDKEFCMSSYLAFRYIEDEDVNFFPGIEHHNLHISEDEKVLVGTAQEIDKAIEDQFLSLGNKKLALLLSGGMDSSILASYMPGCDAYTFRFMGGEYQREELDRAKTFADYYHMNLHYVDVDWQGVLDNIDAALISKAAPVHSIEPQIMLAAKQAKEDGIELMIIGDGSDYVFGGMDKLLSKDWLYEEFVERFTYIDPKRVLRNPADVSYLFDRYVQDDGYFDWFAMLEDIDTDESYGSYYNAFMAADMPYLDPYARLKMSVPLDLKRIRSGESKYLIRELFRMKYPELEVPEKVPMPRPVDAYFKDWEGPRRPEFKDDLNISEFNGNEKWLLWCLEYFLNLADRLGWS